MSEAATTTGVAPTLTVECQNFISMQLKFLFDDLMVAADESKGMLERWKYERQARKVRQVLKSDRKLERVRKFAGQQAYDHHLASGAVGAFGDSSIIEWLQTGGLEQLLEFILGIMGGIANILLVVPYVAMCLMAGV